MYSTRKKVKSRSRELFPAISGVQHEGSRNLFVTIELNFVSFFGLVIRSECAQEITILTVSIVTSWNPISFR